MSRSTALPECDELNMNYGQSSEVAIRTRAKVARARKRFMTVEYELGSLNSQPDNIFSSGTFFTTMTSRSTRRHFFPFSNLVLADAKTKAWHQNQMIMRALLLLVSVACGFVSASEPPAVTVGNIRRVFHNGEHNAFTTLVRFHDQLYLAFRSCPDGHMVNNTCLLYTSRCV